MAHFHWFTPLNWDGRDLRGGQPGSGRAVSPEYRAEVIAAAERLGFESTLCMVGNGVNDPWLTAASLIAPTSHINFIVAVRTGYTHPTVIAQQAASFQNLSGGRLWLNFVSVSYDAELRSFGDFLDKEARYRRSQEFIEILERCYAGQPFDYDGVHFQIEQGGLPTPIKTRPKHFTSGSSAAGLSLGARYGDVHLSYGEPPPLAREWVDTIREKAAQHGRKVECGIRIHVIARQTSQEAWREADRLLEGLDPTQIEAQQRLIQARNSVGQARVQALNPGNKNDPQSLKIYPTMWSGTGLVGGGGGSTALVGSYSEIAERIEEYQSVGIEHFIVSGFPLLESVYEFGEGVVSRFHKDAEPVRQTAPARVPA